MTRLLAAIYPTCSHLRTTLSIASAINCNLVLGSCIRSSNRRSNHVLKKTDQGRVTVESCFHFSFIARIPNRIALHHATGWPRPSRCRSLQVCVFVPPNTHSLVCSGAIPCQVIGPWPPLLQCVATSRADRGMMGKTHQVDNNKRADRLMGSDAPSVVRRIHEALGRT